MFNSLAALSSSSSMPDARSTLTLCIGPVMRPLLVKNRDTSLPSSARRAMASADTGFRRLRVFSIELLLLLGGLPERDAVVGLSFFVLPLIEVKPHEYNSYTISSGVTNNRIDRTYPTCYTGPPQ